MLPSLIIAHAAISTRRQIISGSPKRSLSVFYVSLLCTFSKHCGFGLGFLVGILEFTFMAGQRRVLGS